MAKKKRGDAHGGGHGWFVTFADLMGLMMSFFVMLVAFSTQDQQKLKIVAGSMRDAFGVQTQSRFSGIVETDGIPTRPNLKNNDHINPEDSSNTPSPEVQERERINGAKLKIDREFALASASLRQALQDMPELTEISKHIIFEETKQGLNLEIIDQDGRSMFADGSKVPYDRTRRLIEKLASSRRRCGSRSPVTPRRASCRRAAITGRSTFPPTAPMRSARFSNMRACRPPISTRSPARPTPSRCFPTIPRCRRTAA